MGFFSTKQWVPVELPEVFAFFSDPNNLPRLMPAELQVRVLFIDLLEPPAKPGTRASAGIGTSITFSFRPIPSLPIRQRWVAQIQKYDYQVDHSSFFDRQLRGPFKRWEHTHEFESETRDGVVGTLITDTVDFEVGYRSLGKVIDRWISNQMQQAFAHRQKTLEEALGCAKHR
jgi:ligand-binding SRPBCC domain-containing protein